jgi:hypothetical protein
MVDEMADHGKVITMRRASFPRTGFICILLLQRFLNDSLASMIGVCCGLALTARKLYRRGTLFTTK